MRILVVEDEDTMALSLRRGLSAEGFAVDVAPDGREGLYLATEHDYDAIVLDLMLPEINGYEVCRRLREADDWTPILMLTAKHGELDEAEGLETGADDYLTKPFSFVVLVARLRALLRRSASGTVTTLEAGDLRLDPGSQQVWRGDELIDLTQREIAVLEFLLHRAGQVVSKVDIVEHVWDLNFDGDLNIVEVYVSSLRRKIDAPFDRRSIETVRGAGYRLRADGG